MNPEKVGDPVMPSFQVNVNDPLPDSGVFISQIAGFAMPPLLSFFAAVVSALILWKIVQTFYR